MKVVALIPARYNASRFPGKMMAQLSGKSVILRTYESAVQTQLFDAIFVVTDSDVIFNDITSNGGKAIKSIKDHQCGSDRIAEAAENIEADIIVNVQGDEPFTQTEPLKELISIFEKDIQKKISLGSLMHALTKKEDINNPNNVKVIVDENDFALYFSRSPIPYPRDETAATYFKHIGIYAFRKEALITFSKTAMTPLEKAEKIECIRYLEKGHKIKMVKTSFMGIGIDTPEDLKKAQQYLDERR